MSVLTSEQAALLKKLDALLALSAEEVKVLDAARPGVAAELKLQVERLGVGLVSVSDETAEAIRRHTAANLAETFERLPTEVLDDLKEGNMDSFASELCKPGVMTRCGIMHGQSGMVTGLPHAPNSWREGGQRVKKKNGVVEGDGAVYAIDLTGDDGDDGTCHRLYQVTNSDFVHPITGAVHTQSPLVASNSSEMWATVLQRHPGLCPTKWFPCPAGHRVRVSQDGAKIVGEARNPKNAALTALHYDGQLGEQRPAGCPYRDSRRVQSAFVNDQGNTGLFVVPGSAAPEVKEIIESLFGKPYGGGFETMVTKTNRHIVEALRRVMRKYAVTLPRCGLLMWAACVWHEETLHQHAVKTPKPKRGSPSPPLPLRSGPPIDPGAPLKAMVIEPRKDDLVDFVRGSTVFRVYFGVVSMPQHSVEALRTLLVVVYMQLKGWPLDPYSISANKSAFPLFVNDKSTQNWCFTIPETTLRASHDAFKRVSSATLPEMLAYVEAWRDTNPVEYGLCGLPYDLDTAFASVVSAAEDAAPQPVPPLVPLSPPAQTATCTLAAADDDDDWIELHEESGRVVRVRVREVEARLETKKRKREDGAPPRAPKRAKRSSSPP